ncbi:hypothetical protein AG1IA_03202 [Rhizoctonia solani AG-1 IA]|uniref:Uncharacterized protein n=1 Tax=Thanatephorus cucumeris (strain AG1-IA) TaxID=983506 RepID=L8X116_THACA|nr:hypothetical protein AG1IA_03202 [Rhizoctonia solani AG-1 IA]
MPRVWTLISCSHANPKPVFPYSMHLVSTEWAGMYMASTVFQPVRMICALTFFASTSTSLSCPFLYLPQLFRSLESITPIGR